MIDLVLSLGTDAVAGFEALQARDRSDTAKFFKPILRFGSTNRDVISFAMQRIIANNVVPIEGATSALNPC